MGYRRGFKTEANALANEVRVELGLGQLDRLDPRALATHLEIPILDLSDLATTAPAVRPLLEVERDAFSAATVFAGARRTIVHNDAHAPSRQNSNLAHELAHGLLLHPPTPALDNVGCRYWNQDIEDEATWLAGVLLLSEPATIEIASGHWTRAGALAHFSISPQMIQWRLNSTGALRRVERMRRVV
jgi:Zn-dependent peptidase ImmA (M78 family)